MKTFNAPRVGRRAVTVGIMIAVLIVLLPAEAYAQGAAGGTLDTIVDKFKEATTQWEGAIKSAAISLFWILAAIEFAVSALFLALAGGGFQNFAAEIVKRILVVGLFFFILDQGPTIVDAVIKSFRQLSQNAGGVGFRPSNIFNAGVLVAQKLADNVSFWTDTSKSLGLLIAALVVVICFALIAAIVIVTTVEMYIVTYAGIILLGFGGSTFTKDYAVKYLTYAVSVGLKLMVMGLVVSIGQTIITSTASNFQNQSNTEVYIVVGVAIVLLAVTKALPSMLQSIVVGASVGSNTTLPAAAGAVVGAGAAALGAVAGGAAVVGAAARGSGGRVPVMAGRAMGAVAGSAFNRLAGMPGSRMGSLLGNAAAGLHQQNQQRRLQQQRSLTSPGSSGGGRSSGSGLRRASAPSASPQGSPAGGGRPSTRGSAAGGSGPTGPGSGSPAGGGPLPTSPAGSGGAAAAFTTGSSGSAGQPAAAAAAPRPGTAASQPSADVTPGTTPFGNAAVSPTESSRDASVAPGVSLASVSASGTSTAATEGSAYEFDTTSSQADRAPASAGSEAVPATSGTSSGYDLDGRSAGTAQTINQLARAASSTTESHATKPVTPSEAARSTTYVHGVPLTRWRVPPSKPTKPTTPR